ncbi:hypothetical protein Q31b_18040 [Novipirellula aureliae]|uniref:Uncharacterized protein n=1 Tax=Novipirellula aureliae TaxID=2527966 RepID=A0A5C6E620_9BACT|nr:hypothetical protein Q31b_18040 [Novipirellula aureliae]
MGQCRCVVCLWPLLENPAEPWEYPDSAFKKDDHEAHLMVCP